MADTLPPDIRNLFDQAVALHDRAASDYEKCLEFNQLLSTLLDQLEENSHDKTAEKVMTLLIDCNPKQGARCDNTQRIGDKIRKL